MSKRSLQSWDEVSRFADLFAKKHGFNQTTAEHLLNILMRAYDSSREGKLGIVKATALAMQFVGISAEAIDNELHDL